MRDIKFRFWNSLHKEMIYDCGLLPNKHIAEFMSETGGLFVNPSSSKHRIIMQFTGLLDKNGREIYEGDVVKYQMPGPPPGETMIEYTEEVHFDVGSFDVDGAPLYVVNEVCEVIGNLFEQPELIK